MPDVLLFAAIPAPFLFLFFKCCQMWAALTRDRQVRPSIIEHDMITFPELLPLPALTWPANAAIFSIRKTALLTCNDKHGEQQTAEVRDFQDKGKTMVGGTGIEPVTPPV